MQADTREITIDLSIPTEKTIGIFQQGDIDSHILKVSVTNNRVPYTIDTTSGDEVRLEFRRPDGASKWYACSVDNNVVTIEFVQEMLSVSGVALMKLVIMNQKTGQAIHTSLFRLMIGDGVITSGDIIDNDDYRNILSMLLKIQELQQGMEDEEQQRQVSELDRIESEALRQSNESKREQNESDRVTEYESFKSKYTAQLKEMKEATETAQESVSGIQDAINKANTAAEKADKVANEISISEETITEAVKKVDTVVESVTSITEKASAAANRAETAASNAESEITNIQNTNFNIQSAESKREEAESKRVSDFSTLSSKMDTAITNADAATKKATEAADGANTATIEVDGALSKFQEIKAEVSNTVDSANEAIETITQAVFNANRTVTIGNELFDSLQSAENTRVQQEEARTSAENTRAQAEASREQSVSEAVSKADTATERANNAAQAAEDVVAGKGFIASTEKGAAGGVAPLGDDKKIAKSYLPDPDIATASKAGTVKSGGDISVSSDGTVTVNGKATSAQGTKADSAVQTIKIGTVEQKKENGTVTLPAYPTTLPASDVSSWAKQPDKPSYSWEEITDKPAEKVIHPLEISLNGTSQGKYDGSSEKSFNITASNVGAAPNTHTGEAVGSSNGAHGLRYYDEKLEYKKDGVWTEIKTGGSNQVLLGGTDLSSEATVEDNTANFPIIQAKTNEAKTLFDVFIADLLLGKYSIMLRMKTSTSASATNVLQISTYYSDGDSVNNVIKTVSISPKKVGKANSYQVLGFDLDFNGQNIPEKKLRIKADMLSVSSTVTVSIDYLQVSPAFIGLTSL